MSAKDGAAPPARKSRSGPRSPSQALKRLKARELTLDAYLELRVERAVSHLIGRMNSERLDLVRQTLREQLSEDPVLIEMVRQVTGQVPESTR